MIPPQVVYGAVQLGKKLFGALTGGSGLGGSGGFRYTIFAVDRARLRAFAAEHPDAMLAEDLYARMCADGMTRSADELARDCARLEREHPGCVLVCADFRR